MTGQGHEVLNQFLSNFNLSSEVVGLIGSVPQIEVMTSACVVLLAVSNVAFKKSPDMTMQNSRAALDRIEGKLEQILTTPLNMAIEYYETFINAVMTGNFKLAYEQLKHLIPEARKAFHYANKKDIGIESYR